MQFIGAYLAKIKDISSYYKNIFPVCLHYILCVSALTRSFVVFPGTLAAVQSHGLLQDITLMEDEGPNLIKHLI